jgi:DUF4097 and DUF4098 domain-containing protein YvlB
MTPHLPATLLLLALGSCSLTFFGTEKATRDGSIQFLASSSISNISIDGFNGDISVIPSDGGLEVRAETRSYATGNTQEEAARRLAQMQWSFRESGNTLHLDLTKPDGGANNAGSDLQRLYIPAAWTVDAKTSNGNVTIAAGFHTVLVQSSNGNLDVHSDGKVRLRTSNGNIEFRGRSQDFQMQSSNGSISMDFDGDWAGTGSAHSSNGKISVRCSGLMDCALRTSTSNGKPRIYGPLLESGTGNLSLETSNADINVTHGKN